MFQSCSSDDIMNHSTLRLQQAIHDFKHSQFEKSTLQKKLHIIKQKCETNRKKAKVIQNQVSKIKHVKDDYKHHRVELERMLYRQHQSKVRKLKKQRTIREQSKQNMGIIRNLIADQKRQEYYRIKERQQVNAMRITQNLKKSLYEKRERSLEIKLQEQSARLNKTIYFEKKRLRTKKSTEKELLPLQIGTEQAKQYILEMKLLEKQMTEQLNSSRHKLGNSRLSLKKLLN